MRRLILAGAVGLSFAILTPGARAQVGFSPGFSDPFFLYYGYYLPRQAALAAQPTVQSQLNQVAVDRQNYALADRAGLFTPPGNMFDVDPQGSGGDMFAPFARRGGAQRLPRLQPQFANPMNANQRVIPHFNELQSRFPMAKRGSFPNRNMAGGGARASGGMVNPGLNSLPMGMTTPYAPNMGVR
ncbi:MAG TPA: hypothetical protein VGY53_04010 [Isosphaeraceae bacterium]|nr:hypothetical protein [Isosphaeraceae bacterium]